MATTPSPLRLSIPRASSLLGREAELTWLGAALGHRGAVITIVGPPGVGKTRLALEPTLTPAAMTIALVDLSPMTSGRELLLDLGEQLDAPLEGAEDLPELAAQLGRALSHRPEVLLLLDNCEHLTGAVRLVLGAIKARAPSTRALITSREPTGLEGEQLLKLGALATPPERATGGELEGYAAVTLFVDRAREADGRFQLDPLRGPAVSELVRALDGNPLAIELCAARAALLDPAQLLDQLRRRFELLRGRRVVDSARFSSLEAAIDWSWSLLSEPQRRALAQLAVFRGGATIEAAEAVLDGSPSQPVRDILEDLCHKSLAHHGRGQDDWPRYWLSESIRDFALHRLEETPLHEQTCEAHARHYLDSLGPTPEGLHVVGDLTLRRKLIAEQGNLLAIHDRGLARAPEESLRALLALAPLFCSWGPFIEYLEQLDQAHRSAREAGAPSALVEAGLLVARGIVESRRGRFDRSIEALEAALPGLRAARAPFLEAYVLVVIGGMLPFVYRAREAPKTLSRARRLIEKLDDDRLRAILHKEVASVMMWRAPEKAPAFLKKALLLFRATGDALRVAYTLSHLCTCCYACGDLDEARRQGRKALERLVDLEDRRWAAQVRAILALIRFEEGHPEEARGELERSLEVQRSLRNLWLEAFTLAALGELDLDQGEPLRARERFLEVLEIARPLGERTTTAWALGGLACAQAALGRLGEAESTLDEAEELGRRLGDPALIASLSVRRGHLDLERARAAADDQAEADRWLEAARARLAAADALEAPLPRRALLRHPRRLLAAALEASRHQQRRGLRVEEGGRWFALGEGPRVSLDRRPQLRRVLALLAHNRQDQPGRPMPVGALFAAGWPGERASSSSARNRVHVTVTRLRKLGLEGLLIHDGEGFLLDPSLPIEIRGGPSPRPRG